MTTISNKLEKYNVFLIERCIVFREQRQLLLMTFRPIWECSKRILEPFLHFQALFLARLQHYAHPLLTEVLINDSAKVFLILNTPEYSNFRHTSAPNVLHNLSYSSVCIQKVKSLISYHIIRLVLFQKLINWHLLSNSLMCYNLVHIMFTGFFQTFFC